MASTNKTTNYELSQYIGTDKPTYLGDYNSDMSKIDTAIHGVATSVGTESARINIVENDIGTMANLQTTDKTSLVGAVNEVNTNSNNNATNIGTLANLETENKSTIVNAINEINSRFDFNTFDTVDNSTIVISGSAGGAIQTGGTLINIAYNSDKSIFKIYGRIGVGSVTNHTTTDWKISFPSQLRPSQNYTINAGCFHNYQASNAIGGMYPLDGMLVDNITVKTDGTIEISSTLGGFGRNAFFYLPPCVYFNKNFGA